MTTAVKRACDACHRRKVKCDGVNPCRNCSAAQLSCTYNAVPQKKGPKGSRAKVISELRESQRMTSLASRVQNRVAGLTAGPSQNPTTDGPSPGMVTGEFVKECLDFYFDHMYSTLPILSRAALEQQSMYIEQNRDAYCLVTALCAFVMLQPGMSVPSNDPCSLEMMPGSNLIASTLLLEEAIRVRNGYEYLEAPTLNTVATSYFIFACNYGVESHGKAWYYLREASTLIHMLEMNKEEMYLHIDPVEASRRRRLFWLVFATERAYALQRQRPLTLQATINLPTMGDDPSDHQAQDLAPFIAMIHAFRLLDESLVSTWNKTTAHFTASYTNNLLKQLNDIMPSYMCQDSGFSDLSVNQQWLRTTHWQLSSQGEDSNMGYQFPQEVAREMLANWTTQFPNQGAQLVGAGLIEKIFEIANDTATALSHKPLSRDRFTTGHRERLGQMMNVVAALRNGDIRFVPLLLHRITDALPRLVNPMLQSAPECINPSFGSHDLFDGFGNAGMAQPPSQMHMPLGLDTDDLDHKFADYDRKFSLASLGSGSPESNMASSGSMPLPQGTPSEMTSAFESSPSIMSPAIDYPQGMSDFSFPEMMISRLGGQNVQTPIAQQQHCGAMSTLQSQGLNTQQMHGQLGGSAMGQASPPSMSILNSQSPGMTQSSPQSMSMLNSQSPNMGQPSPQGMSILNSQVPGMGNPPQNGMNPSKGIMPLMHSLSSAGVKMEQPQRGQSFTLASHPGHAPSIPRTVADFHALQRPFP